MPPVIFRKGLDMKEAVASELAAAYHSKLVDAVREGGFVRVSGRLTIHLAREFGFCYGVDRAVDYAYQTRKRFPEKRVFLTGEIIHNPHVNDRLRAQGIRLLTDPGEEATTLGPDDVVILPAFGVSIGELARLDRQGCTLVDTTCGSVLNVWKNVRRYAQDGFTSVIHGKVQHEETRATASQALQYPGGQYLIVRDEAEAELVCSFIRHGGDAAAFIAHFDDAASPGFDPARDLLRVGCANQTTMLMTESLKIGEMLRAGDDRSLRRGRVERALPRVRHHLQRDPGTPGRGRPSTGRRTAGPCGRHRRLQQQQHLQPGPDLRRTCAHVPHRRPRVSGLGRPRSGTGRSAQPSTAAVG